MAALQFMSPWVPLLPCLAIIVDAFLLFQLSPDSLWLLGGYLSCGLLIYLFYGSRHSSEIALNWHVAIAEKGDLCRSGNEAVRFDSIDERSPLRVDGNAKAPYLDSTPLIQNIDIDGSVASADVI